ncbi:MAG TPA: zinc ABC transporter substrate-binding protein [Aquihabitans sp.]|nr:zinc ABC transporter substrate-binding protein [Aquihabitans sp.]
MVRTISRPIALLALVAALSLAACGSSEGAGGNPDATIQVVASFYPLQWVTERVGGDVVSVRNLTPTGAEPHDLELTPKDVAKIDDADLVVYLSGFQAAVDDAVADTGAPALDAADHADLDLAATEDGHDHADEADDHAEEADDHGEEAGVDPHFWLDPTRLAKVADAVADRLTELDPDEAATFQANAKDLRSDLDELDADLAAGLADCSSRDLVTSHAAFGYLAQRYDLEQVGISGISPDAEPSPSDLADLADFVEEHDVRTIYFETLVSPAIARTLADETGAETAVLDPIEGLTDDSQGADYLEIMRSNLANLQSGQPCP